jgi:hypothetical protein
MHIHTVISVVGLCIFAVVVYDFSTQYVKATSSGWQRIWDAGRGSATMVMAQLGAIAAGIAMAGDKVTDFVCGLLNAPGAADQIKAAIGQYVTGQNVGIVLLIFTALVAWARSRSLKA